MAGRRRALNFGFHFGYPGESWQSDFRSFTPALLFPAISLLFQSYTNRFLDLAALIRKLHSDWLVGGDE